MGVGRPAPRARAVPGRVEHRHHAAVPQMDLDRLTREAGQSTGTGIDTDSWRARADHRPRATWSSERRPRSSLATGCRGRPRRGRRGRRPRTGDGRRARGHADLASRRRLRPLGLRGPRRPASRAGRAACWLGSFTPLIRAGLHADRRRVAARELGHRHARGHVHQARRAGCTSSTRRSVTRRSCRSRGSRRPGAGSSAGGRVAEDLVDVSASSRRRQCRSWSFLRGRGELEAWARRPLTSPRRPARAGALLGEELLGGAGCADSPAPIVNDQAVCRAQAATACFWLFVFHPCGNSNRNFSSGW